MLRLTTAMDGEKLPRNAVALFSFQFFFSFFMSGCRCAVLLFSTRVFGPSNEGQRRSCRPRVVWIWMLGSSGRSAATSTTRQIAGGGWAVNGTEGPPDGERCSFVATQVQASQHCQDSIAGRDALPTRTRHSWRGK